MRSIRLVALGFVLLTALDDRVLAETLSCHDTQHPRQVVELLFGRNVGRRLGVSEAAWTRFVLHEMLPRFPEGMTITDAMGLWRDRETGMTMREPAKRVEIALSGNADDEARIEAVVVAYKRQFRQRSVGVIERTACVSF
jgi:hypothetical protein